MFDGSVIPHNVLLLFGGAGEMQLSPKRDRVAVGPWVIRLAELHAVLYKRLQRELELLLRATVQKSLQAGELKQRQQMICEVVKLLLRRRD